MSEREEEKSVTAEEILARIQSDEITRPLGRFFEENSVSGSIRIYEEDGDEEREILVSWASPDIVMKLSLRRNGAILDFHFVSEETLEQFPGLVREKPEAFIDIYPQYSSDPVPPIAVDLRLFFLDVGGYPAQHLLMMLADISTSYAELNKIRKGENLSRTPEAYTQ
jgi:hypothetical protein